MALEPITSVMSSSYAETIRSKPEPVKMDTDANSQSSQAAEAAGMSDLEIVPVMEKSGDKNFTEQDSEKNKEKEKQPSQEDIKAAVSQANDFFKQTRTNCAFSYDEVTNRVSIKVYDAETEEVIKEIPPEESLKLVKKMWKLAGLIVDEKL